MVEHSSPRWLRDPTTPTFICLYELVSMCEGCHHKQIPVRNCAFSNFSSLSYFRPLSKPAHLTLFPALLRFDNLRLGLCGHRSLLALRAPKSAMSRKSYFSFCLYLVPLSVSCIPRCLSWALLDHFDSLLLVLWIRVHYELCTALSSICHSRGFRRMIGGPLMGRTWRVSGDLVVASPW